MESPVEFEQAVWSAFNQCFVDYDAAVAAIAIYELEYATMQRKYLKPNEHEKTL
jgi:cytochrome c peroxidase